MSDMTPIPDVVHAMKDLAPAKRTEYLQEMIGAPTDNQMELNRRALLITALNETHIWPYGCPGSGEPNA